MTKVEEVAAAIRDRDIEWYVEREPRFEEEIRRAAMLDLEGNYAALARAAIAAMRIPTASMRTAFWDADEPTDAGFIAGWAAAIDKALEGEE